MTCGLLTCALSLFRTPLALKRMYIPYRARTGDACLQPSTLNKASIESVLDYSAATLFDSYRKEHALNPELSLLRDIESSGCCKAVAAAGGDNDHHH